MSSSSQVQRRKPLLQKLLFPILALFFSEPRQGVLLGFYDSGTSSGHLGGGADLGELLSVWLCRLAAYVPASRSFFRGWMELSEECLKPTECNFLGNPHMVCECRLTV